MIDPDTIPDVPGFLRLDDIPIALSRNAVSDAPWNIRFAPPLPLSSAKSFDFRFCDELTALISIPKSEEHKILGIVEAGLRSGNLSSVGAYFDEVHIQGMFVELTPAHWSMTQTSVYAPLEGSKDPFAWALSVGMIRLFPTMIDSPLVLPLVSEAALAVFLGAQNPPAETDLPITSWEAWRDHFRSLAPAVRRPRSSKGGRPLKDPTMNKAMWHEVVRRTIARELDGKTLQEVTHLIHNWMDLRFGDKCPEQSTVRLHLEGLFPKGGRGEI